MRLIGLAVILVLGALLLAISPQAQADSEYERRVLVGPKGVFVLIEDVGPEPEQDGPSAPQPDFSKRHTESEARYVSTLAARGVKKRVFLSFIAEDKQRVQGLRLLAANPDYDLEFYDESVRAAIDSRDADYIKRVIREKIGRTSVTVCLISEETYKSGWVDWELEESFKKGNKIIAMALKDVQRAVLPKLIKDRGLTFHGWDPAALNRLIAEA